MTVDPIALTLRAKIIGALIRDARLAAAKSIPDCAEAISIDPQRMEAYELGDQAPSLPELEGLAYYLDVPVENFWGNRSLVAGSLDKKQPNMPALMMLRNRMVGATLRQARLEAGLDIASLSQRTQIPVENLEAFELGQESVPLPQLEVLSGELNRSLREFLDRHGPVGAWTAQQRAVKDFLDMPPELQEFVSKPINRPYLELAIRLSEMSVDRLRGVAEGLLEITY
ncbi:MAG: helix-turn-helix domain-containing protein [Anaerolineales bacterium]|nr:helix-turn-helix domain-containing protein [Anaerolineales bacterium]